MRSSSTSRSTRAGSPRTWARAARPGEQLVWIETDGGYELPPDARWQLLVGDLDGAAGDRPDPRGDARRPAHDGRRRGVRPGRPPAVADRGRPGPALAARQRRRPRAQPARRRRALLPGAARGGLHLDGGRDAHGALGAAPPASRARPGPVALLRSPATGSRAARSGWSATRRSRTTWSSWGARGGRGPRPRGAPGRLRQRPSAWGSSPSPSPSARARSRAGPGVVGSAAPGGGLRVEVEIEPERARGGVRVEPLEPALAGRHRRADRARVQQPLRRGRCRAARPR